MLIEQRPGAAKSISFLVECSHLGFSLSVTSRGVDTTLVSFLLVEIPMGLEDESQKVGPTTVVGAKDLPDSVNHTDKLEEEFQKAVAEAKDIPDSIDHMDKLALYGLFKAATVGKCNIEDPGMLNITANAKYRAWKHFEGKTKDEAKAEYIAKTTQIREDL
jgi:diazepam-binding inhibitor (GABA receptor modulating acyl-CoA-binding protein)